MDKITILSEEFDRDAIPHIARMWDTDRAGTEVRIQSIADAWHNGNVVSAIQALESDLGHG